MTLDLAHGLIARGASVDLVLMEASGALLSQVPDRVRIVPLGARRLRDAIAPLRAYLRAARPEAMLAAMWPLSVVAILAAMGLRPRPRVVIAEHAALIEQYRASMATLTFLRSSIRLTYRFADAIVAVSRGLAAEVTELAGLARNRVETIHNPILAPARKPGAPSPWPKRPGKRILGAGRLHEVKNFALMIEAFAPIAKTRPAMLAILGEGDQRAALEGQAAALGIVDQVLMPGFTETPGDWYTHADLFVLTSDYEGFGNVIVEAMHEGLPVVAVDCPFGPRESLGGGRWGTLVPMGDAAALTRAIDAALDAPRDPARQKARAEEFSLERALDGYWRALFPR